MGCCEARPEGHNSNPKFDKVHFDDDKLKLLINNSFIEVNDDIDGDLFGEGISPLARTSSKGQVNFGNTQSGRNSTRRCDPARLSTMSTPDDMISQKH